MTIDTGMGRAHRLRITVGGSVALAVALVASLLTTAATAAAPPAVTAWVSQASETVGAEPGQYPVTPSATVLNQPPDPYVGRITPTADAAEGGMFGPVVNWPVIAIHATLNANGRLTTFGTPVGRAEQGGVAFVDTDLRNLDHRVAASQRNYNAFCNGMGTLADGRVAMVGGNSETQVEIYDPTTQAQQPGPGLNDRRWYGSVIRRPDNQLVVMGGAEAYNTGAFQNPFDNSDVAITPEIGDGFGGWRVLRGATSTSAFGAANNRWWYPRAYNAPDGSIFGLSWDQMWRLDTNGDGSIANTATLGWPVGATGSSAMFDAGKILFAGGGDVANRNFGLPASARAAVVDINGGFPAVTETDPMAQARNWHNVTVLPNGEVLASGGVQAGDRINPVYNVEIWNPSTGQWRRGASQTRIRTYHSSALLLPSGAVFTGGGGVPGPEDNFDAEWYLPPYLFERTDAGVEWADRPRITSIAGSATWGGQIELGLSDDRSIVSASLISVGNVTHSYNADQRRIPLAVNQTTGGVSAVIPDNRNLLPPGSYLLQVVDADGVPSPSQTITLKLGEAGSVTVYDPQPECRTVTFANDRIRSMRDQDRGSAEVLQDGAGLRVADNGWKAVEIDYFVTERTMLEFDFRSSAQGEIHSIGFTDTLSGTADGRRFELWGTQATGDTGIQNFRGYGGAGDDEAKAIPVGQFFQGRFRYLMFTADNDAAPTGESTFSNVRLYERDGACDPEVRPAAIGGAVINDDGSPRPGINVDLFEQAEDGSRGAFLGFTTTGDDGRYGFADLQPGCRILTFVAPDGELFANDRRWFQPTVCIESGEQRSDVDVAMAPPTSSRATLTGATTYADGEPAADVLAVLYRAGADGGRGRFVNATSSGPDGRYEFVADPGCYVVDLVAPDGASFAGSRYRQLAGCAESGETAAGLDGLLTRDGELSAITGRVAGPGGSPEPGVQVDLFRTAADGSRGRFIGSTRTGDDGTYRFEVGPGCHTVTFVAPDERTFNGSRWFQATGCADVGQTAGGIDATLDGPAAG
jgi:5-hydroxyisourate hydrolase-like protein (transthyretin family)